MCSGLAWLSAVWCRKPPAVPMGSRMDILLQYFAQARYFHCRSLMLSPTPVPGLCLAELEGQHSLEQSCCSRQVNQAHLMPTSLPDKGECFLKSLRGIKLTCKHKYAFLNKLFYGVHIYSATKYRNIWFYHPALNTMPCHCSLFSLETFLSPFVHIGLCEWETPLCKSLLQQGPEAVSISPAWN